MSGEKKTAAILFNTWKVMSKIVLGIYDEPQADSGRHPLRCWRSWRHWNRSDRVNSKSQLLENLKAMVPHILIINLHELNPPLLNLISQISSSYSARSKILKIISVRKEEEIILRTIKGRGKGLSLQGFWKGWTDRSHLYPAAVVMTTIINP